MKRLAWLLPLLLLLGCPPNKDQSARDAAAALKGLISSAQTEYQSSCSANPQQTTCQTINRGISAQNALITATELYCGWATSGPPPDQSAPCTPVPDRKAALDSAVNNANQLINELKGIVSGTTRLKEKP